MKTATLGLVCLLTLAGPSAEKAPRLSVRNNDVFTSEFNGEIMDSFCAEDGHHIGVNNSHTGISGGLYPHMRQARRRTVRAP